MLLSIRAQTLREFGNARSFRFRYPGFLFDDCELSVRDGSVHRRSNRGPTSLLALARSNDARHHADSRHNLEHDPDNFHLEVLSEERRTSNRNDYLVLAHGDDYPHGVNDSDRALRFIALQSAMGAHAPVVTNRPDLEPPRVPFIGAVSIYLLI